MGRIFLNQKIVVRNNNKTLPAYFIMELGDIMLDKHFFRYKDRFFQLEELQWAAPLLQVWLVYLSSD